MHEEIAHRRPRGRTIAAGHGWRASEFVCRLGPGDLPFEEQHQEVSIAAVLAGSFAYRSETGRALHYPGAFLFGNAGFRALFGKSPTAFRAQRPRGQRPRRSRVRASTARSS